MPLDDHFEQPTALPVHVNRTQFEAQDILVPWHLRNKGSSKENCCLANGDGKDSNGQQNEEVFYRFYHVFHEGELESLCEQVADTKVIHSYYDKGNWCIIFVKQ